MTVLGRIHAGARLTRWGRGSIWLLLIPITLGAWLLSDYIVGMPLATVIGVAGICTLIVAGSLPTLFPQLFLSLLGLLLFGYAFFGRAFAHLGAPPIFVGEAVLAVGLLALLTNRRRWVAFRSPIAWLYLVFAALAAARALTDLPVYGLDTLRDSVLWGYGVFAILVPASVIRPGWVPHLLQSYARWMPLLVLWLPIGLLVGQLAPHLLPTAQDSGQSMVFVKPGDAGIHLAGAAVFLLLGLHHAPGVRARSGLLGTGWLMGAAGVCAFFALGVLGRGGAVAALVGIFTVLIIRPLVALPKLVLVGAGTLVAALTLVASNFSIELGRRDFSAYQLTSNLLSLVGDVDEGQRNLEQTKDWRLRWWTRIVDYTVYGPYFWTGKGFGVNLATDDGVKEHAWNRSPHSGHMSVLARMGVPGAVLWVLLQTAFGASLLSAYLRARRSGQEWWARLDLWILAYWLAFLTAMSFGVYLEGPHGGIWFWSLFGLGIAVLITQRQAAGETRETASRAGYGHEAAARP
jgi:hypothetical protein